MDELRHHIEQGQDRTLDLADQLEEGGHHAEGDGACAQLQTAPDKAKQIAQSETGGHDDSGKDRETGPPFHAPHEPFLRLTEPVGYPLLAAKRAEGGIVLHPFLYLHLDAALLLADVERHLPERTGDGLGKSDDQRRQQQQGPRQGTVHRIQQQKSARKLDQGYDGIGNQGGGGLTDRIDIF